MLLPSKFNEGFTIQWLYEGNEIRDFTTDELQAIALFDPLCVERQRLTNELLEKIINPLIVLFNKHLILKEVLIPLEKPSDRLLYNLIEDAARQNITDFYDLKSKFIDILIQYKSAYSPLFHKKSQEKLFTVLKKGASERACKYSELSNLIDQKRNHLFCCFDKNGGVQTDRWDEIIDDVTKARNVIKTYRDKVASHADKELVSLSWEDATKAMQTFINYTSDIYTVLSFRNHFEMQSNGLQSDSAQTIKSLRSILF